MSINKMNKSQLSELKGNELWKLGECKLVSPLLPLAWAHLGTPQSDNPKYDGKYGMYRFDLVIDPSTKDGQKFIAKLETAHDHMMKYATQWSEASGAEIKFTEGVNLRDEKDSDKKPTGNKVMKFKKPAKKYIKKKDTVINTPILVVDCDGNVVPRSVLDRIGNGTMVQVMFDLRAYHLNKVLGTTVKVVKVRLVELKEYGNNINDDEYYDDDFGAVEGSFKVSDVPDEVIEEYEVYYEEDKVDDDGDF